MAAVAVIVLVLIIWGLLTKVHRAEAKAAADLEVINIADKKQITFEELATKRHNIHTAHNLINLGLVLPARFPLERAIQNAYDGLFEAPGTRAAQIARFYGLDPDAKNFVGH
jgi:hypothetical protein